MADSLSGTLAGPSSVLPTFVQSFAICTVVTSLLFLQVDRLGRRALWLASGYIILVSYILVTALSATYARTKDVKVGYAVIIFLFVSTLGT